MGEFAACETVSLYFLLSAVAHLLFVSVHCHVNMLDLVAETGVPAESSKLTS